MDTSKNVANYIDTHQKDVNDWLISLGDIYVKKLITDGEEEANEYQYSSRDVLDHAGRMEKVVEVLEYYQVAYAFNYQPEVSTYNGRNGRYSIVETKHKAFYTFKVDAKKLKKMVKPLAKRFDFIAKSPDKETDRVLSYPTLDNLDKEGICHYWINPKQYNLYDRIERTKRARAGYSKDQYDERRVIRLYPKNLESKAERAVFERALDRYFEETPEKFIEILYGLKPEMLCSLSTTSREETLRALHPYRSNTIEYARLNKEYVQKKLESARQLLEYADKTVKDLEELEKVIPNKLVAYSPAERKKAEEYVCKNAPLMVNSDNKYEKALVSLVLKGSNKGLI